MVLLLLMAKKHVLLLWSLIVLGPRMVFKGVMDSVRVFCITSLAVSTWLATDV